MLVDESSVSVWTQTTNTCFLINQVCPDENRVDDGGGVDRGDCNCPFHRELYEGKKLDDL